MKAFRIVAIAAPIALVCGCAVVDVGEASLPYNRIKDRESSSTSCVSIAGIEPVVETDDNGDFLVSLNLFGSFKKVTTTTYSKASDKKHLAIGFFPGVMSCEGEYGDCVKNGLGVFFYNLVFAGLPTVYGLFAPPLIPYYPDQTRTIVSRRAFVQSTLIGFAAYSKRENGVEIETGNETIGKVPLEDVTLSAPTLGISSSQGRPLWIPRARVPVDGKIEVRILLLPDSHPFSSAMSEFKDKPIKVFIKGNKRR